MIANNSGGVQLKIATPKKNDLLYSIDNKNTSTLITLAAQHAPVIRLVCELHKLTTKEYTALLAACEQWRLARDKTRRDVVSLSGGAMLSWLYEGGSLEQAMIIAWLYEVARGAQ